MNYGSKVNATKSLGENLRRIFIERGTDYFDKTEQRHDATESLTTDAEDVPQPLDYLDGQDQPPVQSMTVEELDKMRKEVLSQLS